MGLKAVRAAVDPHAGPGDATDLPENVKDFSIACRGWIGVTVDVAEFRCTGPVLHRLRHEDETRLSVILEEIGGQCEPRTHQNEPCRSDYFPRHMHFAPAGMAMWGYSSVARLIRDANLTFDLAALSEQLSKKLEQPVIKPGERFSQSRLWTLVDLLASAVFDNDPSAQLYGDGLATAITARLFCGAPDPASARQGLSHRQLRRVTDYLHTRLPERVELSTLASLAGVSQSHFGRAFKASTGMAPYRWQIDARLKLAQSMMIASNVSLEDVAAATGFADAVHFSRMFRKMIGASPALWRHARKS
jgi:AraC family transcriptional regulator